MASRGLRIAVTIHGGHEIEEMVHEASHLYRDIGAHRLPEGLRSRVDSLSDGRTRIATVKPGGGGKSPSVTIEPAPEFLCVLAELRVHQVRWAS